MPFDRADRTVVYGTLEVGGALSDNKTIIRGSVNGIPISIRERDGVTANAGIGVKYSVTKQVEFRIDERYRYIDRLINVHDTWLNTLETTVGVAYKF